MKDLLTVKDVAKILGLSTNTVYKYLNSGAIRSNRANLKQGRFRVSKKAVEEFLGAPLEELEAEATPHLVEEIVETVTVESTPAEVQTTQPQQTAMEEKYDQLLKSLVLDDATQPTQNTSTSSPLPKDATSAPTPQEQTIQQAPPTFASRATRLLLLLGLVLYVVNLAYFSVPHPIALFTQLSILFLFILLTYQYGGMKRRSS